MTFTDPDPSDEAEGAPAATASPSSAENAQDSHSNGLRMFDLGSVPASVTPPRTWRRAAWFAAASSGGVMGLLFAGTFLFGQQPSQPQATGDWSYLNRHGGAPLLEHYDRSERMNPAPAPSRPDVTSTKTPESASSAPSSSEPTSTGSSGDTASRGDTAGNANASRPGHGSDTEGAPAPGEESDSAGSASPSGTAATTQVPQKPPPSPAETTVTNERYGLRAQRDVRTMAQVSEEYLNTVTENPKKARQYTTGELRAKGADGLRRKYSRIAYFEVRTITVNEGEGVTVNTVEAVYNDGHKETQQRRLTFGDDNKISRAGR